jgi:predicted small lipoprotein YifL
MVYAMNYSRLMSRLLLAGALVAALGLGACGRKGPLDPPPGASLVGEPQANMPELMSDKGKPAPATGAEAVQPAKKHIFLDGLLN